MMTKGGFFRPTRYLYTKVRTLTSALSVSALDLNLESKPRFEILSADIWIDDFFGDHRMLNCNVLIADLLESSFVKGFSEGLYSSVFFVIDEKVEELYQERFRQAFKGRKMPVHWCVLKASEEKKTFQSAGLLLEQMHAAGLDRKSLLVAVGGGVVTDLAGFAASCYMRGIDTAYIPTTLLGMCDAALGGKTGVNLASGKNIVGSVHQPRHVIIDPAFLTTLSQKEFKSGLAEVIKCSVISGQKFFESLETHKQSILNRHPEAVRQVIEASIAVKMALVKEDEKEHGKRALLNFGHTFGHAIETVTGYKQLLHGEAVSIGMILASKVSQKLGFLEENFIHRLKALCQSFGLPVSLPPISIEAVVEAMTKDKKAVSQTISLVLLEKPGCVLKVDRVEKSLVYEVLKNER